MNRSPSDAARKRQRKQEIQRQLDEALDASFPASDPVAIVTSHNEEDWDEDAAAEELPPGQPTPPAGD
jgi:2-methylcitrate dehydratase PrpD